MACWTRGNVSKHSSADLDASLRKTTQLIKPALPAMMLPLGFRAMFSACMSTFALGRA